MVKEVETFETRVMIDNHYDIVACMNEKQQQFIGLKCYDAFDFINKDEFMSLIDQTIHSENEQQINFNTTKNIETVVRTKPIFSPSMSVVTCLIYSRNKNGGINELSDELNNDQLLETNRYATIIDTVKLIPMAATILDPNDDYKYLEWTESLEEISRIKKSDVIGKTRFDLYHLRQAQKYHKEDVEAIESGKMLVGQCEYEFTSCYKAESKYLKTYRLPIYDNNNKALLLIVLFIDITDSILQEKELLQAEKLSLIGQLAAGIAHNIGNQLSTMNGALSVIKLLDKEKTYEKYTGFIKMAINNSSELIHQLLDFSRKSDLSQKRIDVHEILGSTVEMTQCFFQKNTIIETKFNATWSYVKGDASRIQNTVLNMLINARDAMPNGGVIRVITHNDEENEAICIHIEDEGEGMDQVITNKVFDPFFTTKQAGKGTGMGLAMAYGNIKQMNGTINVNSCKGVGTVFTIQLPIVKDVKVS